MVAEALPLLAGGPPGWIAFAVLTVATVAIGGAIAYQKAKERSESLSDTDTATATTCKT